MAVTSGTGLSGPTGHAGFDYVVGLALFFPFTLSFYRRYTFCFFVAPSG
jgi:hypothetical protein